MCVKYIKGGPALGDYVESSERQAAEVDCDTDKSGNMGDENALPGMATGRELVKEAVVGCKTEAKVGGGKVVRDVNDAIRTAAVGRVIWSDWVSHGDRL